MRCWPRFLSSPESWLHGHLLCDNSFSSKFMFCALCFTSNKINLRKSGGNKVGGAAVEAAGAAVLLRCHPRKRSGGVSWGDCAIKGDIIFLFSKMVYSAVCACSWE